jgi:hypothetical protein
MRASPQEDVGAEEIAAPMRLLRNGTSNQPDDRRKPKLKRTPGEPGLAGLIPSERSTEQR